MTQAVRLSPSGPVITSVTGVGYLPGHGAQLRLAEATCTSQTSNVVPTVPAVLGPVIGTPANSPGVSLAAPNPALFYRATVICDVQNVSTNVDAQVELYFDTSPDGATWTEVASNSHVVKGAGPAGTARQIRLDLPMQSGANIGVVAGQANLFLRTRIGASTGGGTTTSLIGPSTPGGDTKGVGCVDVQLQELF